MNTASLAATSYIVVDTFRAARVSTHRTLAAAVKGQRTYGRACPTLPTVIRAVDVRGRVDSALDASRDLTKDEVEAVLRASEA